MVVIISNEISLIIRDISLLIMTTIKIHSPLINIFSNIAGPPAAPSDLVQIRSFNAMTTATITWEFVGNNVFYTVFSASSVLPFSKITQTSYILCDLEVETDYIVSVTATNECGTESPPSEEIIVRIDVQSQGSSHNVNVGDSGPLLLHIYLTRHPI